MARKQERPALPPTRDRLARWKKAVEREKGMFDRACEEMKTPQADDGVRVAWVEIFVLHFRNLVWFFLIAGPPSEVSVALFLPPKELKQWRGAHPWTEQHPLYEAKQFADTSLAHISQYRLEGGRRPRWNGKNWFGVSKPDKWMSNKIDSLWKDFNDLLPEGKKFEAQELGRKG